MGAARMADPSWLDIALFLGVLIAWTVGLVLFSRTERFKRWNLGMAGPILMVRTVQGKRLLDRLATRRRFWTAYGDASLLFVFIAMFGLFGLLIYEAFLVPTIPRVNAPTPDLLLGIPGLNRVIPLGYGVLGLAVAIVLHEFAHGILSRVANIKVQSLGVLLVILPVGAFVEPDEKEMQAMPRRERLRLYAVGPATNLLLAVIFMAVFSGLLMPSAQPNTPGHVPAVGLTYVDPDGPAGDVGLHAGWIITSLNGTVVTDVASFTVVLQGIPANKTGVPLYACYRGACEDKVADLSYKIDADRNAVYGKLNVTVTTVTASRFQPLGFSDSSGPIASILSFTALPFSGHMPAEKPYTDFYVLSGPLAGAPDLFWILASATYYLFWLDLMLGATNALPAIPLDGGYIFRDAMVGLLQRLQKGVDVERHVRVVRNLSYAISLFILALILWQFVGPRLNA